MDKTRLRIVLLDKDFRILDHMGWAVSQENESAVLALYVIPEEHSKMANDSGHCHPCGAKSAGNFLVRQFWRES
jgi:hypothetical protein